jgi:hypothetical protein
VKSSRFSAGATQRGFPISEQAVRWRFAGRVFGRLVKYHRQTADVPCFLTWNATGAEVCDSHLCRELTEVTKAIRITTDELTVQVKSSGTIKTRRGCRGGAPLGLNIGATWRSVVSATLRPP